MTEDSTLPAPAATLEGRLQDDFTIAAEDAAGGGVMGARKLTLAFQDGFRMEAKWKTAPAGGDGWNNSPRREVGAWAVQELFLDAADYPIPPVVARGISLDVYRIVDPAAEPNLDGTRSVFGGLAAWLQNVSQPARAFDPERFARDARYAFHFANLNLLAYLIAHRDARGSNFLMPTDPSDSRVFSIDNGIAFGGVLYNFFTWHFDELRTVGLPRQSIERLRRISRQDLTRFGILGQLAADSSGVLRAVTPGDNLDPEAGVRVAPDRIQFGLTVGELDAMEQRRVDLLVRIDAGEISLI